jgi:hypothetical protein
MSTSGARPGRDKAVDADGPAGQVAGRRSGEGARRPPVGLASEELAVVAASLRQLARRLERYRDQLSRLEAALQSRSGRTSRSTRDRRSPKRSRSS